MPRPCSHAMRASGFHKQNQRKALKRAQVLGGWVSVAPPGAPLLPPSAVLQPASTSSQRIRNHRGLFVPVSPAESVLKLCYSSFKNESFQFIPNC